MKTTASQTTPPTPATQPELIDTIRAARLLRVSSRTLEKWRCVGNGPPFLKLGRRVVYAVSDIEAWIRGRQRSSTSEL